MNTSVRYGYEGKRVVITGAASGVAAAATELLIAEGAEIYAVDIHPVDAPVAAFSLVDLADRRAIGEFVRQIDGPLHTLFNCAGLPPGARATDTFAVNYLGLRALTEGLLPYIEAGGAVVNVASRSGLGWSEHLPELLSVIDMPLDEAETALAGNPVATEHPYGYSKELVIAYTMARAAELCERRIRMNCVAPGPVDTPMMRDSVIPLVGADVVERSCEHVGRPGRADEVAHPMLFLGSDGASYVSGAVVIVDFAGDSGRITGRLDPPGSYRRH